MLSYLSIILAHAVPGDAGVIEGFLHPLLGFEHLLAMVAVGLVSAQIGKRAIWTVPLAFVVMMAIGGIVGFFGVSTPIITIGIAVSLVLLGLALVIQQKIPEAFALVIVGIFAIFHGYAHGEAIPPEQTIIFFIAYVVGFVISTAGLHVIGALLGYIALRSERGVLVMRISGALIGITGMYFLLNTSI
jgi:urease accessory protein